MSNYLRQRQLCQRLLDYRSMCRELGHMDKYNALTINVKRELRAMLRDRKDPIAQSMQDDWRTFHGKAWDSSWYVYGIIQDEGQTDDELHQQADDERVSTGYAFDCTGRPFTQFIHWSRTPAGIVWMHCLGMDV